MRICQACNTTISLLIRIFVDVCDAVLMSANPSLRSEIELFGSGSGLYEVTIFSDRPERAEGYYIDENLLVNSQSD